LRTLTFFHEFSHAEIWEVLRASDWHEYKSGEDIVREGEMDDRFYIIVAGQADVEANGKKLGVLSNGDCFGETSYVRGAKRTASIRASGNVTILRVSSTLMEQVSSACQLRFNKVFLRSLITRLQGDSANTGNPAGAGHASEFADAGHTRRHGRLLQTRRSPTVLRPSASSVNRHHKMNPGAITKRKTWRFAASKLFILVAVPALDVSTWYNSKTSAVSWSAT